MAEITAAQVKELREMTGAGMMECKKALVEAEGEIKEAVDVLRTRGLAAAEKKAGRATNEGVVAAVVSEDGKTGALAELNCETDFVSANATFGGYASKVVTAVLNGDPADMDALKATEIDGETVETLLTEAIHTLGENMQIARFVRRSTTKGALSSYIHGGGRMGILVEFAFDNAATFEQDAFKTFSRDIAMQVAASCPLSVSRDDVPADVVEHELSIYKAQAAESGKPEAIQEKMAIGRIEKFYKENCLVEQPFIKDPDKIVKALVAEVSKAVDDQITIVGFDRFVLGETTE